MEKKVVLGSVDKDYTRKLQSYIKRKQSSEKYAKKINVIEQSTQVILEDSGEDEDLNYSDEDFLPLKKPKKELFVKSPTNPLKAKEVCQMADRLNLSLNQATGITAAILKCSGVGLDAVAISKTSCHQYRQENRAIIKSSFVAPEFCVLHWDGKVMEDPHKKRSDRLAILISGTPGYELGKLLGVLEIVDSTGSSQATATFSLVQQWDLADNIVGLSFDTTASNSGWQNGACVKIEILLEKKMFYFACRFHILERLQSAA